MSKSTGTHAMIPTQRDIPGLIARWLFRLGFIWAIILIPCLIIAVFSLLSFEMAPFVIVVYILAGYLVWIGWCWRSRLRRTLRASAAFWLGSTLFNSIFIIWCFSRTPGRLLSGLFFDFHAFNLWWGLVSSICSLIALYYEFKSSKYDNP